MIKLNYSYTILFASTVAGVGTAADSTPTAVLWRNGSASGVSVTVSTTAQTGLYKAVFTTDSGWSAADFLELYVTAAIAGTSGYLSKVWSSTEIGAAELNAAYLFDDGFGRKAVNANVTHYQGTLQGNGDLPAKLDAIKDVTNKIDTGLVLDGVVWQFTVNMLEAAIAEVPKYGDTQKHTQEDYNVTNKTVDVTVTKVT